MTEKADEQDKKKEEAAKKALEVVNDEKKRNGLFRKKIFEYSKPTFFSVLGVFFSFLSGADMPVFAALMMQATFDMLNLKQGQDAMAIMNWWAMWLLIVACITTISTFCKTYFFTYVSEGLTERMRHDVYKGAMRKHMGWHDERTNNAGSIGGILEG